MHGTGGILGGILTGFFASPSAYDGTSSNGVNYYPGVFYAAGSPDQARQLGVQAYGCLVTALYSGVASFILLKLVDRSIGLREAPEQDTIIDNEN